MTQVRDNVYALPTPPPPAPDIDPKDTLQLAMEHPMRHVIIIGCTEDGHLFFASSTKDAALIHWDMEQAKMALLHNST